MLRRQQYQAYVGGQKADRSRGSCVERPTLTTDGMETKLWSNFEMSKSLRLQPGN